MTAPPTVEVIQAGDPLHAFHGGLRLRHNKAISCRHPLSRPPLPAQLVVPLLQHRGQPAEALVTPGQVVLKGDLIGRAATNGAHVHAPTSGTVEALETRGMAHVSGRPGPCVVIRPDGEERWRRLSPLSDWREADPSILLKQLRAAGIVGLGGGVYPTDEKAGSAGERGVIETLILNGAECEPYIACDEMLMREAPERVLEGARILAAAVGARRVVLAYEDPAERRREAGEVVFTSDSESAGIMGRDATAASALQRAAERLGAGSPELIKVPARYPEGGERQLIETLTGREVPEGSLPTDMGLLVQNVGTAAAVYDAIVEGKPLIERVVTVTGNGVREPRNFLALIGTPVAHLVEAAGGYTDSVARLVVGGPMMGYPLPHDAEPVVKASNCLLALDADDIRTSQPEMPCIRCGDCVPVCPSRLLPQELQFYARGGRWDEVEALGVNACIECGCCDAVCPSHIPLAGWFRFAKGELRKQDRERVAANHARERFEAREARLAQERRAREERAARRKRKLADQAGKQAQIKAALERARRARDGHEDAD